MNTKFNSVADAAAQLAEDPAIGAEVKNAVVCNSVVSALLQMRVAKGLTQEDVARASAAMRAKSPDWNRAVTGS